MHSRPKAESLMHLNFYRRIFSTCKTIFGRSWSMFLSTLQTCYAALYPSHCDFIFITTTVLLCFFFSYFISISSFVHSISQNDDFASNLVRFAIGALECHKLEALTQTNRHTHHPMPGYSCDSDRHQSTWFWPSDCDSCATIYPNKCNNNKST